MSQLQLTTVQIPLSHWFRDAPNRELNPCPPGPGVGSKADPRRSRLDARPAHTGAVTLRAHSPTAAFPMGPETALMALCGVASFPLEQSEPLPDSLLSSNPHSSLSCPVLCFKIECVQNNSIHSALPIPQIIYHCPASPALLRSCSFPSEPALALNVCSLGTSYPPSCPIPSATQKSSLKCLLVPWTARWARPTL